MNDLPDACSAWNPGVGTGIPHRFRPLETIFRPECSFSTLAEVEELASLTGLPAEALTGFRPQRLALHEVIVRVTADIAVAEGEVEENFGQNFRAIAQRILEHYVEPHMDAIVTDWNGITTRARLLTERTLTSTLFAPATPPPRDSWRQRWFGRPSAALPSRAPSRDEHQIIADFKSAGLSSDDPLQGAVYRSLYRLLGAIEVKRGRIGSDHELLTRLVTADVGNTYGSQLIGQTVGSLVDMAIADEGFVRVPDRSAAVLISLKGASAAGKSSLRPMIKQIQREQGIEPDGYATISPDVWRRLLLDYEALGPAHKYAGHLTSRELVVIDGKLDRYIRAKANRNGAIPHLLVDRFRFDSFASEKVARVLHDTYARHVDTLLMYFVVTPPAETVERGWQRALERGRYKAVEDYLGHSVEAYAGMPKILFKWLACERPKFHYYFLDNRVPKGTFPKTIAFGNQHEITIYDPQALIDIERYQKVDIHAVSPDRVYPPGEDLSVAGNTGFLREICRRIPRVNFYDYPDGTLYARCLNGAFAVLEPAVMPGGEAGEALAILIRPVGTAKRH